MQRDIVYVSGDAFRVRDRNFAELKIILINLSLMQYSTSLIALASHFSFRWTEITTFLKREKEGTVNLNVKDIKCKYYNKA